jgi:hypothetical protein
MERSKGCSSDIDRVLLFSSCDYNYRASVILVPRVVMTGMAVVSQPSEWPSRACHDLLNNTNLPGPH